MAISALTCPPPVRRADNSARPDYELLHTAIELFENGQHAESLAKTFAHLFPNHDVPDLGAEPFSFGQGSSRVTVRLKDDSLEVEVPLVRLTSESITTAALRFVLSNISATGQLYQPCLRGDDIYLEFTDRLTRLHPHKVREVLRLIPVVADANDDWMVTEFRCDPLKREPIEALTEAEAAQAETIWATHWREVDELVKESQRKRSMFFLNEVTAYAVHHIDHALPLTGYWWSRISAAAETFNDTNFNPSAREAALRKCIREMQEVSSESLRESLGHAKYAILPHAEGTPKVLKDNLGAGNYLDAVLRSHNGGRYMEAAVAMIGSYNYLLAKFSWSSEFERLLLAGLAMSTGKPWREATTLLLEQSELLIAASEESESEETDDASVDSLVDGQAPHASGQVQQ